MTTSRTVPGWDDRYAIGSELVDSQHQRLFELLAMLCDAERGGCDESVVDHAVQQLYGYIRYHFADEERLMEELQYPERGRHRQLHDTFVLSFDDLVMRFRGRADFVPRLIAFIQGWLISHIIYEDSKIRAP